MMGLGLKVERRGDLVRGLSGLGVGRGKERRSDGDDTIDEKSEKALFCGVFGLWIPWGRGFLGMEARVLAAFD